MIFWHFSSTTCFVFEQMILSCRTLKNNPVSSTLKISHLAIMSDIFALQLLTASSSTLAASLQTDLKNMLFFSFILFYSISVFVRRKIAFNFNACYGCMFKTWLHFWEKTLDRRTLEVNVLPLVYFRNLF